MAYEDEKTSRIIK